MVHQALLLLAALCPPDASPQTHSVVVNEREVVYDVAGDGEPALVFVHGGISTRDVWTEMRDTFAPERRVLTIDLPGHGGSAAPVAYEPVVFSDAVLAAMDDAEIEHAVLVGHSFGVSVSRDVALAAPDRIAGLFMLDGFVVPVADPATANVLLTGFESEQWETAASTFVDTFMLGPNTPASVAERVRGMMLAGSQDQWLEVLGIVLSPQVARDDVLDLPTRGLFLGGDTFPPGYEDYLCARFSPLTIEFAPQGTGHFLMWERPLDVECSLRELLMSIP